MKPEIEAIRKMLAEGRVEEANAAMDQLEMENEVVFKEPKAEPVENKALEKNNPNEVANLTKVEEVKDVATPKYEEVFAKIMLDRDLSAGDKQVFEKVNNAAYTHEVKTQLIF